MRALTTKETAPMKFATRLNSFATRPELHWKDLAGKPTVLQLLQRASTVKGLTHVDLNFPNHMRDATPRERSAQMADLGLKLNGFALRYYSEPQFKAGSFTHPGEKIRREAIDIAKRGVDALKECGGSIMTFWPGQDGFEYPFQTDYICSSRASGNWRSTIRPSPSASSTSPTSRARSRC
jgi:xylose isomerase